MSRRLQMTTADYLTIAVSPALIMTLIGSFVFFLIEVFYQGQYQSRLNYVFALFVFAAVLIGRISIEQGTERATLFAIPLAVVTFLVVQRFVEHASAASPLINLGIIALVWWCAHKLTWDCTVIDDRQDASGEGLLQAAGLVRPPAATGAGAAADSAERAGAATALATGAPQRDPDQATSWWERYQQRRRRGHAPGVWVLYFSLAALPLFGLLQRAIPLAAADRRAYTFKLLLLYVASALALLLTTSFLGLRRYLRQRQLEMPAPMAGTWIVTGAALILVVMILAALLPRPAAEVPLARLPFRLASREDLSASRRAPLRQEGSPEDRQSAHDRAQAEAAPPTEPHAAPPPPRAGDQDGRDQRHADDDSGRQANDRAGDPAEQRDDRAADDTGDRMERDAAESGDDSAADGTDDRMQRDPAEPSDDTADDGTGDRVEHEAPPGRQGPAGQAGQRRSHRGRQEQEKDQRGQQPDQRQTDSPEETDSQEKSRPAPNRRPPSPRRFPLELPAGTSALGAVVKLLFYAVVLAVTGFLLWRNRSRIGPALARLWQELRQLWTSLWGGHAAKDEVAEVAAPAARRRRFADFADPFTSQAVSRMAPEALVTYTFRAFQAWAHEHGHPRDDALTPRELVRRAAPPHSPLADAALLLAEMHSQVTYGAGHIPAERARQLRGVWTQMRALAPPTGVEHQS